MQNHWFEPMFKGEWVKVHFPEGGGIYLEFLEFFKKDWSFLSWMIF